MAVGELKNRGRVVDLMWCSSLGGVGAGAVVVVLAEGRAFVWKVEGARVNYAAGASALGSRTVVVPGSLSVSLYLPLAPVSTNSQACLCLVFRATVGFPQGTPN